MVAYRTRWVRKETHSMEARKDVQQVQVYFSWRQRRRIAAALERGILASWWDDLAAFLVQRGHAWYTIRRVIEIAKLFASHAEMLGVSDASELSEELVNRYLQIRHLREGRTCLRLLMLFLGERGIVNKTITPEPLPASPPIVVEYLQFLRDHRGTGRATSEQHRRHVEALLETLDRTVGDDLSSLSGAAIQRFITQRADGLSRAQRKVLCAAIRSFLRFLYLRGDTSRDLVPAVPVIPSFKLERLPTAIETDAIERILAAVDRSSPVGRRDYAMLLLLATYGLRASQLCALRLEDINWRRQLLRIPGAKGGRDLVLPLRPAVGEAIIDYLQHGRPIGWSFRQLFLRVRAPIGPLRGGLTNIIRPYARKAGLELPSFGSHAWRHACATRMLARGQPLKTIRHILGHSSIETTFIYTKLDLDTLRQAALEWPEVTR